MARSNERLEYVIGAVNRTQRALGEVEGGLGRLLQRIRAFNQEGAQGSTRVGAALNALGAVIRRVFGIFSSLIGAAVGALGSLLGAVFRVVQAVGGALAGAMGRVFGGVMTAAKVAVAGLVAGMVLLARQGINVGVSLESTGIALATLMRNAGAARGFLAALRTEAKSSTFEFVDLASWSKKLLGYGFSGRESMNMLRTLGDMAIGMEGTPQAGAGRMQALIEAFGKLKARGVVNEETTEPFQTAGINVRRVLGIPEGQELGKSGIKANVAIPKILAAIQSQWGGVQNQIANTLPGRLSNIKDTINDLAASVTRGLYRSLTDASGKLLDFLGNLEKTKAGKELLTTLSQTFDLVGRSVDALISRMPVLVQWLARALNSDAFVRFRNAVANLLRAILAGLVNLTLYLVSNWPRIWEAVQAIVISAVKVIGGGIAAIINVMHELTSTQDGQISGWQRMGEAMKVWASTSIKMLTVMAERWANWGAVAMTAAAGVLGIMAVLTKNTGLAKFAAAAAAAAAPLVLMTKPRKEYGGQSSLRHAGFAAAGEIEGLSLDKIGQYIQGLQQQPGILGAAARGYQNWGLAVDQALSAMGRPSGGFGGLLGGGGAGAPGAPAAGPASAGAAAGGRPNIYLPPWAYELQAAQAAGRGGALQNFPINATTVYMVLSGDWRSLPDQMRNALKEFLDRQAALAYGGA